MGRRSRTRRRALHSHRNRRRRSVRCSFRGRKFSSQAPRNRGTRRVHRRRSTDKRDHGRPRGGHCCQEKHHHARRQGGGCNDSVSAAAAPTHGRVRRATEAHDYQDLGRRAPLQNSTRSIPVPAQASPHEYHHITPTTQLGTTQCETLVKARLTAVQDSTAPVHRTRTSIRAASNPTQRAAPEATRAEQQPGSPLDDTAQRRSRAAPRAHHPRAAQPRIPSYHLQRRRHRGAGGRQHGRPSLRGRATRRMHRQPLCRYAEADPAQGTLARPARASTVLSMKTSLAPPCQPPLTATQPHGRRCPWARTRCAIPQHEHHNVWTRRLHEGRAGAPSARDTRTHRTHYAAPPGVSGNGSAWDARRRASHCAVIPARHSLDGVSRGAVAAASSIRTT